MNPRLHSLDPARISGNALAVVERLQGEGYSAFLVGGCVRDLLLGKAPKDFDVATDARPEEVCKLFRRSRIVGRRFRIVHVRFGRELVEITTFRGHHAKRYKQNHSASGMTLKDNIYGTFEEDAYRRDFGINAIYYQPQSGELLDPLGGQADLARGCIRTIGEPKDRFREDPVRMLRALRFKAKLGFALAPETEAAIADLGHLVQDVPPARLFEEMLKLFMHGFAERVFDCLLEHGVYQWLFPSSARTLGASGARKSARPPRRHVTKAEHAFAAAAGERTRAPGGHVTKEASAPAAPPAEQLVRLALRSTDSRVAEGLPVTPAFIYAAILWQPFLEECAVSAKTPEARDAAMSAVLRDQHRFTSVPRRFGYIIKDIWAMQSRLPNRQGKKPDALLEHRRFRAAYDFLLLREEAEPSPNPLGPWWTEYQSAPPARRQQLQREAALARQRPA